MFDNCTKRRDRKRIFTAKEEGKIYTLNNPNEFEIAKVKIDGCVFNEQSKKCDWLFLIETQKAIFVELKGSDINQGLKQLWETYDKLKDIIGGLNIWFRLSIGEKNSVPKSVKDNRIYRNLFFISDDNLRIGKRLSDVI